MCIRMCRAASATLIFHFCGSLRSCVLQPQGNRADFDKRFTGEEEIFTFRRVESRLSEMMSVEYLRLQHLCFVTQDVDVDLLLRSDSIEPYPILPASAEAVTLQAGRGGESGGMGQGYA